MTTVTEIAPDVYRNSTYRNEGHVPRGGRTSGEPAARAEARRAGDSPVESPSGSASAAKIDDFESSGHIRVVRRGTLDQDQVIARNALCRHPLFRP